jgi:hypothetical protein
MVKAEQVLLYVVPLILGIGVVYWLTTRPSAQAVIVAPPTPVVKKGIEDILIERAMRETGLTREQLTIRGLRPQDLGVNTFDFNIISGTTNIINTSVANNRFIAFTGVSYWGKCADEIQITIGGATTEIWPNLKWIAQTENKMWTDESPSIAGQNMPVRIDVKGTCNAVETIGLQGIVVERRGMVLA